MTTTNDFAKHLRRNTTEAERKLWYHLRRRGLNGFRFIRQVPIGPFVVDFLCRERRLIIEVDGATHGEPHEVAYDLRRTLALRRNGYAVYRVDNVDVYENIEGVLDSILLVLEERPAVFASSNRRDPPHRFAELPQPVGRAISCNSCPQFAPPTCWGSCPKG